MFGVVHAWTTTALLSLLMLNGLWKCRAKLDVSCAVVTLVLGALAATTLWFSRVDRQSRVTVSALLLAVPVVALAVLAMTRRGSKRKSPSLWFV